MQAIGIVGLGAMGLPLARALAGRGFDVTGYDISPERRTALPGSRDELAGLADRDAVVLSLPDDAIVADTVLVLRGLLRPGSVIVDTSTVSPATTRKLQRACGALGVGYVDAPVSGGASGAAAGTLLVMAGGEPDVIEQVRPVLDAISRKVVICGGPGAGNVVKLVNNMLCAGHLLLAGEALRLAAAGSVERQTMIEALNAGSGRSAVTEVNLPRWVLSGAFDSAFSMALMTKDVSLAAALEGAGPLTKEISSRWQTALSGLGGAADFNRIVEASIE